jgi:hypothetical protein
MVEEMVRRRAADPTSSKVAQVAQPAMGETKAMGPSAPMMFSATESFVLDLGTPIMLGVNTGISRDTTGDIIAVSEVTISIDIRLIPMFVVTICLGMALILVV